MESKNYPKIGIRPVIDGRRGGIRESLEGMTMAMAEKLAELYSAELRYSDGSPAQCVIADTTIGGVAEAALAAEKEGLAADSSEPAAEQEGLPAEDTLSEDGNTTE